MSKFTAICLATLSVIISGCNDMNPAETAVDQVQINVKLEIDFQGESENLQLARSIRRNSTVLQLMKEAREEGLLDFVYSGEGETAFIHSISNVKNDGAGGSNWIYQINDELAKAGCGTVHLQPDDRVSWKYHEKYQAD